VEREEEREGKRHSSLIILSPFIITRHLALNFERNNSDIAKAHMYNQHTRGMETTRHRRLVERGGRKALLETLQHQEKKRNIERKKLQKAFITV